MVLQLAMLVVWRILQGKDNLNTTKRTTVEDTTGKGKAEIQDKDGFTPAHP